MTVATALSCDHCDRHEPALISSTFHVGLLQFMSGGDQINGIPHFITTFFPPDSIVSDTNCTSTLATSTLPPLPCLLQIAQCVSYPGQHGHKEEHGNLPHHHFTSSANAISTPPLLQQQQTAPSVAPRLLLKRQPLPTVA